MEMRGGNTENVVQEFAALLRRYDVSMVWSDRYGQAWVRDAFARYDIELKYSELNRSQLYLELLPALRSQQVELLDLPKLRNQLQSLERRTTRGSRDIVDHPSGGHDDLINAAAGALVMAACADRYQVTWSTDSPFWNRYKTDTSDPYLEMERRALVRSGNLNSDGRPIDAGAGPPVVPVQTRIIESNRSSLT
jgi:hypothetical protein